MRWLFCWLPECGRLRLGSANQIDNITNGIYLVERSVRMMQCGLVFFMLLFSEYLGISRRNVVFGIAVGFGFFAAVNMLVMTAIAASHRDRQVEF